MPLSVEEMEGLRRRADSATDEDLLVEFTRLNPSDEIGWCEVIKEVVGFANKKGGVIVFDCADDGTPDPGPPTQVANLDPADISNKIFRRTREHVDLTKRLVVHRGSQRSAWFIAPGRDLIAFPDDAAFPDRANPARMTFSIRKGTVYIRGVGASAPATTGDLREAIDARVELRIAERSANLYSPTTSPVTVTYQVEGVATEALPAAASVENRPAIVPPSIATSRPEDLREK